MFFFRYKSANLICTFLGPNQPYSPTWIMIKCPQPLNGRYVTVQKINVFAGGPRDVFLNEVTFFAI